MQAVGDWIAANASRTAVFLARGGGADIVAQLAGKVAYLHTEKMARLAGFNIGGRKEELVRCLESDDPGPLCPAIDFVVARGRAYDRSENWIRAFNNSAFTVFRRL
jgi:hypothetical protein